MPIIGIPLVVIAGLVVWWAPWKSPSRRVTKAASAVLAGLPEPRLLVSEPSTPPPPTDTLGVQEMLPLRDLLKQGRYEALTERLDLLLAQTGRDIGAEQRLAAAWGSFELPELREPLDRWVDAQPDAAVPRLIRAEVLASLAYSRRGAKVVAETTGRQLDAMAITFDSALADLRLGIAKDPSALPGYWTLIRIAQTAHDPEEVETAGAAALVVAPASFITRTRMMTAFLPRWGGSYERMEQLAKDAQAHAGTNPLLASLRGFADMDRSDEAMSGGDSATALRYSEASLRYGASYRLCVVRARMLLNSGRVAEGLAAAECARDQSPTSAEARVLCSYAYNSTGVGQWPRDWAYLFGLATAEARVARQLAPDDPEVEKLWEFIRQNSLKTLGREP